MTKTGKSGGVFVQVLLLSYNGTAFPLLFSRGDSSLVRIIKPIYLFLGFVLSLLGLELLLRQRSAIRSRAIRPPGPIDASTTRIVVLGDSIAHAPDLPAEQAWPALLEKHLQDGYPDRRWQVINASVSGSTTADAYVRFDQHVRAFRPDLVLIALGLNDCRQVYRAIDRRRIASFYQEGNLRFQGILPIPHHSQPPCPATHSRLHN